MKCPRNTASILIPVSAGLDRGSGKVGTTGWPCASKFSALPPPPPSAVLGKGRKETQSLQREVSSAEKAALISDSFGRFAQGIYWWKTPRAVVDVSGLSREG